jgi:hypothetical protein
MINANNIYKNIILKYAMADFCERGDEHMGTINAVFSSETESTIKYLRKILCHALK